jgi:hypothetical protein
LICCLLVANTINRNVQPSVVHQAALNPEKAGISRVEAVELQQLDDDRNPCIIHCTLAGLESKPEAFHGEYHADFFSAKNRCRI